MNTYLRKQIKEKTDCQINKKQLLRRILCIFMANHFSASFCRFDLLQDLKTARIYFGGHLKQATFVKFGRYVRLMSLNNLFV